jgi:signal transduction histidine kinase
MAVLRPRLTIRMRLAALYTALFSALSVVLVVLFDLVVMGTLPIGRASEAMPAPGSSQQPAQIYNPGPSPHVAAFSAVALMVLLPVSAWLGWCVAGRNLRPLRAIITTANDISARNLHQRLRLTGPRDEFLELGATLDGLFERLDASFESQRRFVANASHELRTPLAAERSVLQVALSNPDATEGSLRLACREVLELGAQQERLIEALLTLACGERGVEQWQPFDLAEIASRVVLDRQAEAARRGLRVQTELSAAPVTGDPALAESLVANLVDNALRHNEAGGQVYVSTTIADGRAVVAVGNTGPVIPATEVDRLFQPFQRLRGERIRHTAGYGLGLAIVRAIAGAHGAALTASARPAGGLDIEVSFP